MDYKKEYGEEPKFKIGQRIGTMVVRSISMGATHGFLVRLRCDCGCSRILFEGDIHPSRSFCGEYCTMRTTGRRRGGGLTIWKKEPKK